MLIAVCVSVVHLSKKGFPVRRMEEHHSALSTSEFSVIVLVHSQK